MVRCRKFILGRDIGWGCRCAMSWCDHDLASGLAVVNSPYNISCAGYISETVRCRKLLLAIELSYFNLLSLHAFYFS